MKVLGIIPARFGSSRFPGKPLIDLAGKTMIQRVYEGTKNAQLISEVIVATDDQRIFDEVIRFGGKAMMTLEKHPSGTDRCGEVAAHFPSYDIVVNIQGDEPLVDYRQLDALIAVFEQQDVQIATLGIKESNPITLANPNRIKVVLNHKQQALYFSRSQVPNFVNGPADPFAVYSYMRHIGLYAYRTTVLQELIQLAPTALEQVESLEQLRWLYYGYSIQVVETTIETPNIDVPADVALVLKHLRP